MWEDRKVTVMGLGSFGGGAGAALYLAGKRARVTVTDLKDRKELSQSAAVVEPRVEKLVLGQHREEDFTTADCVVVNPAVRRDNRYVQLAEKNGVDLETEITIFLKACPAFTVGITGSNGKSTTASLCAEVLSAGLDRKVYFGGNIGRSLLDQVDQMTADDVVVLELSSFQLAWFERMRRSVNLAILTNLSPNHLDWHDQYSDYIRCKLNLMRYQNSEDIALFNAADPALEKIDTGEFPAEKYYFTGRKEGCEGAWVEESKNRIRYIVNKEAGDISTAGFKLAGRHNLENLSAAVLAGKVMGVADDDIQRTAEDFQALPHRLELVARSGKIRFYDDSIATTPEAAILAIRSFTDPVVLIAGGSDKGLDMGALGREAGEKCRGVVLIGEIATEIEKSVSAPAEKIRHADDMQAAVACALDLLDSEGVVLLSPGTASYDMFRNYRHRGEVFREAVKNLIAK